MRSLHFIPLLVITAAMPAFAAQANTASVNFSRHIQPLIHQHCAECHGGVKRKGGLSLVMRAQALGDTESGKPAIVPGQPHDSELIARITSSDADERMPPEKPLSPQEISVLKRWIAAGADWPQHWSLRPITKPESPPVKARSWLRSEIDRFVLARLEGEGIQPSPQAGPRQLIRRLSLDLSGLLPEPGRVEQFVQQYADNRDAALEALTAELLASPHFGERWGRHWLDEARYADSAGYEKDSPRQDAFRFRDWVIRAVNRDMPFDLFTIKQIAGDLLPDATDEDLVATQFHLMTQFNLEGGVDAEEDRTKRVMDRIITIGSVWLATTIECAQCHNHPYDPLSQRDFYQLYAFFNNADFAAVFAGQPPAAAAEKRDKRRAQWTPVAKLMEQQLTNKNLANKLQAALTKLRKFDNANGFTRVLTERVANRRQTYVFNRGNFQQPLTGEGEVEPATPGGLPPLKPRGRGADRLDLARWLVSAEHPLTARATVNKVWMHLFGAPWPGRLVTSA